jgi:hypothetical protein
VVLVNAVALVVVTVWTGVAIVGYRDRARRTAPLLLADLGITAGLLLVSPWLTGDDMTSTVPGFWVMGAMLAWSICWRVPGGAVAAVVLAGSDLLVRAVLTDAPVSEADDGNIFLLLIGGPIVGYMCEQLYRSAAEQEAALRALIRREDTDAGATTGGTSDLAARLRRWEWQPSPRTEVAAPAGPVALPDHVVEEVHAPVGDGRLGVAESIRGRMGDLGGRGSVSTGSGGTEWELEVAR